MTAYQNRTPSDLSPAHRRMLEDGSAIAPDVLEERGVYTVSDGRDLPKGFSRRQRRRGGGILFRLHRPNGETSWCYRPDAPDLESQGRKYEMPCKAYGGPGNVLDIHPSQHHLIADKRAPVIFVEGVKKGDAITTAARAAGVEVLVVVIVGVWNWLSGGKPISDMLDIPLKKREVRICFDSDVFRNPDVGDAAKRLEGYAVERGGAAVQLAYLPDQADGSKTGADDFLAGGRSYAQLAATFKPFDSADLAAERLKRGDMLRIMLEDLRRRFWAAEWKGMGGHSSRDVFKVLVDLAGERAKLHEDGLRVRVSRAELARMAKVSSRTLQKAIERLEVEEMGLIYRDNEGRRPRERGAFVLRATVNHYGEGQATTGGAATTESVSLIGTLHLRAPRQRWSSPAYKPRRGTVTGTRRVRQGPPPKPRPAVKRPGKIRGALVDALDAAGGEATIEEICDVLHRTRPRDLVRFKASEKGHDGPIVMLLEAGIVQWVGDRETRREVLRLTPDWLQRLEEARQLAGEVDVEVLSGRLGDEGQPSFMRHKGIETLQREHHKRQGEAFRRRLEVAPTPHWTNTTADGAIEALEPEEMSRRHDNPEPEAEKSPAAEIVLDYVRRLGKIRLGLLEQIWLEDHGGDLRELRRAVDESGARREQLREFRNAVFLYPPAEMAA